MINFWGYAVRNLYNFIGCSFLSISSGLLFSSNLSAQEISEADLKPHIKILASDEYEGRLPGTEGGVKTAQYMAEQWFEAGLIGGTKDGGFYQTVPLVRRDAISGIISFNKNKNSVDLNSSEIALSSRQSEAIFSAPTIFGGYGVKSDGNAIDNVKGKTVFIRAGEANFLEGDEARTQSRIAKLTDAGALAVIVILGEEADWARFRRFAGGRPVSLQSTDNISAVGGLASFNYGQSLAKIANLNWNSYLKQSDEGDFNGIDLGLISNVNVKTNVRKYNSYNVIAKLPGSNPDAGAVFFTGHWDHTGLCGPIGAEDRICNGAIDNASGMSVLIEVAKHLGKQKFDRDIYFVGTTAEESGLLGAYHMVEHSPVDINKIVIALNVDTIAIAPKGSKVAIIGRGTTDLDPIVEDVAMKLGRDIEKSEDANAFIRRQDGWALASRGVPALMVGGSFADLDLLGKFLNSDYHTVRDEYSEDIELGGAAEDAVLHLKLAEYFANISTYSGNKAGE